MAFGYLRQLSSQKTGARSQNEFYFQISNTAEWLTNMFERIDSELSNIPQKYIWVNPVYFEIGKIFSNNGATDFTVLAASDQVFQSGDYYTRLFQDVLAFPSHTPFLNSESMVSAAFVTFSDDLAQLHLPGRGYMFIQVYRRSEGEKYSQGYASRPFNQTRFTIVPLQNLQESFGGPAFYALFKGIMRDKDRNKTFLLNDYKIASDAPPDIVISDLLPLPLWKHLEPDDLESLKLIVNALASKFNGGSQSHSNSSDTTTLHIAHSAVSVIADVDKYQNLDKKLALIELAQILLRPLTGTYFTFALDYITERSIDLYFFDLPHFRELGREFKFSRSSNVYYISSGMTFPNDYFSLVTNQWC